MNYAYIKIENISQYLAYSAFLAAELKRKNSQDGAIWRASKIKPRFLCTGLDINKDGVYHTTKEPEDGCKVFESSQLLELVEFVKNYSNKNSEVVLNGEYTAKVSENGIKVGCQKISFAAFDTLAEAVKKARS